MLNRSAKTATYGVDVAKVEINLPDDLLERVDRAAEQAGETRDEFLARIVGEEVARVEVQRRKELEAMMGPPRHGGGDWGEWMRQDRRHRDDNRYGPAPADD
jgi:hypothetical protein